MRIGLQIPNFTYPDKPGLAGVLKDIVQTADEGGFYSLWVMDHFFQIRGVGPYDNDMLEGYTTLGYFAALTQRVKLGTLVTGVIYRYPGILVKTVTTLDVLSGGRAYFGVGAAWNEQESVALGIPFPPVKVRFEQLEEALQIALQMWSGERRPYEGKHNQLGETLNQPQPITQPHPPIMIGGMGEQKTLRMVAQYADACNFFVRAGTQTLQAKLDVLKRHCDTLGRDYEAIEKTGLDSVPAGEVNVAQILADLRQYRDLGFTHVIFNFAQVQDITPLEVFANEIIPAVAEW
jgi:F420-dependent oxidoreductase-like protein